MSLRNPNPFAVLATQPNTQEMVERKKQEQNRLKQSVLKAEYRQPFKKQEEIEKMSRPFLRNTEKLKKLERSPSHFFQNIEDKENIFKQDLPENDEYSNFLEILLTNITQVQNEIKNQTGDIVSIFPNNTPGIIDEQDKIKLEELEQEYIELYGEIPNTNGDHYVNEEGRVFPNYLDDMLRKFKDKSDFMVHKTEEEMKKILDERVENLQQCFRDTKVFEKYQSFYEDEYQREEALKTQPNKERCRGINWGPKYKKMYDLYLSNPDKYITDKLPLIEKFLENTSQKPSFEKQLLKTFLSENDFNSDGSLNLENIIKGRKKQYMFGFETTFKNMGYLSLPELFNAMGMMFNANFTCGNYSNWNLLTNLLYNYCAILQSDNNLLFPIRFIFDRTLKFSYNNSDNTYNLDSKIKNDAKLLFNSTLFKFIGCINIKYNYFTETTKNDRTKHQLRNWVLFVFKPVFDRSQMSDKEVEIFWRNYNLTNASMPDYIIVNLQLDFIEQGNLFKNPSITHLEMKHFYKYEPGMVFYRHKPSIALEKDVIFIRKGQLTEEQRQYLGQDFEEVKIEVVDKGREHNFIKIVPVDIQSSIVHVANLIGGKINKYNTIFESLFFNKYINKEILLYKKNKKLNRDFNFLFQKINYLYKYILIIGVNLNSKSLKIDFITNKLPKYKNIIDTFYENNEIIINFLKNVINKKISILQIGIVPDFIETLIYNNYQLQNIDYIYPSQYSQLFQKSYDYFNIEYINKIKSVYKIDFINFNENIYNLFNLKLKEKKDLIMINNFFYEKGINIYMFELQNYLLKIVEVIYALKNLNEKGSLIILFNSITHQPTADLYLWLKKHFQESHLYYPDISNRFKNTGTYGIFKGFKELSKVDMDFIENYLLKIQKDYPNSVYDFNVYDKKIRELYNVTKPITTKAKSIEPLLNLPMNSPEYQEFLDFNNNKYLQQLQFIDKLEEILEIPEKDLPELPTQEQITASVMYCKKWNIDYYPYFDTKVMRDKMGHEILNEMYGNIEPINYKFKTPHTTKTPTKLSVGKIKITLSKIKNHKLSYLSTSTKSISRKTKIKPFLDTVIGGYVKNSKKTHKNISRKTHKKQRLNREVKEFKTKMSIIDSMFDVNNQISQTGYMIDSRRDFEVKDYNLQLPKYFRANVEFRYYKARGDDHKYDLTQMVRSKIHRNVSQAWLKFYEILSETNIINKNNKTLKTFHLCEAPGSFIDCLAYYLRKETKITKFEWNAQSHKKTKNKIYLGDDFKLIKQNPNNWNWGADGDGDITSCNNILSYKPLANDVELITSDCGIPMGTPGYEKIVFSSMVAITYLLPLNGNMIFKILTPIETPIIWNIIYLWFNNFKELRFFKPIQNAQSREFYIIGKGYLGTDKKTVDLLLELVKDKTDKFEKIDLFDDKYPETFVLQLLDISKKLADNWCFTIQKQIYYSDNLEYLDKSFYKNAKDYIQEKNLDFIEKYNLVSL